MRFLGLLILLAVLMLDQVSKWMILEFLFRAQLGLGDPMRFFDWLSAAPERFPFVSISLLPFFNLTMVWNEGISFGFLQGHGWQILTVLALVISAVFLVWMMRSRVLLEIIALAFVIGGAIGNVFDRIRFGAVADFFDFYWKNWHFPAFNIADSAITLGVILLLIQCLFFAKNSA